MDHIEGVADYGIVLGRLQPIHLGHVEYLQAAKDRCKRLVVGITNPDIENLDPTAEDIARSMRENNPFSYFQRMLMVEATCRELGWKPEEFVIVPAPITRPGALVQFLPPPEVSEFFVTIYDKWGEAKKDQLEALGFRTTVLWRRTMDQRLTSGTKIRQSLADGTDDWRHVVSPAIVDVLSTYARR